MVSQFRNNPEFSAQVLATSGIFQTSSSNTKDFNINLIIACIYRFMSHPIDQIEFLSLSRHLLELLHKVYCTEREDDLCDLGVRGICDGSWQVRVSSRVSGDSGVFWWVRVGWVGLLG
jgi:hypothetical protein